MTSGIYSSISNPCSTPPWFHQKGAYENWKAHKARSVANFSGTSWLVGQTDGFVRCVQKCDFFQNKTRPSRGKFFWAFIPTLVITNGRESLQRFPLKIFLNQMKNKAKNPWNFIPTVSQRRNSVGRNWRKRIMTWSRQLSPHISSKIAHRDSICTRILIISFLFSIPPPSCPI